jgi:hypothetical protein
MKRFDLFLFLRGGEGDDIDHGEGGEVQCKKGERM